MEVVFFSHQNRKHENTILLQEQEVANYVKSAQTHPERGLFSLLTKSGSRREFKSGQSPCFLLESMNCLSLFICKYEELG